tara:strand:- start:2207 stop:2464 length:258 start_codon:yes stop_codon:yes gene_type:complete
MVKHSVEEAERMKGMPSPHYDVEEGSLSDDPSDLNHLRALTVQFQSALEETGKRLNADLGYLRGLAARMVELAGSAYEVKKCQEK